MVARASGMTYLAATFGATTFGTLSQPSGEGIEIMDVCYRIASGSIVADVVEDEAVILNLESGAYFSLQGIGCDVWVMLISGHSADAVGAAMVGRYAADEAVLLANVASLTQELVDEGVIVEGNAEPPVDGLAQLEPVSELRPFQPCSLRRFDDMQSLLLLDPIHDVDETGWPNANAGA